MPSKRNALRSAKIVGSLQVIRNEAVVFVGDIKTATCSEDVAVGDEIGWGVACDDCDDSLVEIADPAQVFVDFVTVAECVIPNKVRIVQGLDYLDIRIVPHEPLVAEVMDGRVEVRKCDLHHQFLPFAASQAEASRLLCSLPAQPLFLSQWLSCISW